MSSDAYIDKRNQKGDRSGNLLVGPTVSPVVLIAARNANWTIYLQNLRVHLATPGFEGSYWSFRDSTFMQISGQIQTDHTSVSMGFPYSFDIDFGPNGIALTAGADFVFDPIASGAYGTITWNAYHDLTTKTDPYSNKE